MLGLIKRSFSSFTKETLSLLFNYVVRPLPEYGDVIWYPRCKAGSEKIERVQWRATKLIPELGELTYQERLRQLDMLSLHYRRQRGHLIEGDKIIKDLVVTDHEHFFVPAIYHATRGRTLKLLKESSCAVDERAVSVKE